MNVRMHLPVYMNVRMHLPVYMNVRVYMKVYMYSPTCVHEGVHECTYAPTCVHKVYMNGCIHLPVAVYIEWMYSPTCSCVHKVYMNGCIHLPLYMKVYVRT